MLSAEQEFYDSYYTVKDYAGNVYEFIIRGYIDRIDYRINRNLKKVFIKIADYKTGLKKYKEKSYNNGDLIQYAIYKNAVMNSGKIKNSAGEEVTVLDMIKDKIANLENDAAVKEWEYDFECFDYVFPMDESDSTPLRINKDEMEGINFTRLKAILTLIKIKNLYPDHKELFEGLDDLINQYQSNEDELKELKTLMTDEKDSTKINNNELSNCGYCKYKDICTHKKAGEF